MKHFEDLWEESEKVSAKANILDVKTQLHSEINILCKTQNDDRSKSFGKILYLLCYLSFKWNVNTFSALLKETQNRKIDMLDDQ